MITDCKKHKLKCPFPNKNIVEEFLIEETKDSLLGLVGNVFIILRYKELRKYLLYEYSFTMFK
jgi:hypothetical protein